MVYIGTKRKSDLEELSRIFFALKGRGYFARSRAVRSNSLMNRELRMAGAECCRFMCIIEAVDDYRRLSPAGGAVELRMTRCGCRGASSAIFSPRIVLHK